MKGHPHPPIPAGRKARAKRAWDAKAPCADVADILQVPLGSLHNFARRWGWTVRHPRDQRPRRSTYRPALLRRCERCNQRTPAQDGAPCQHCAAPWIREGVTH